MHFLGNRIGDSTSDASAYNADFFQPVHLRRPAERPDDISDDISLFHGMKHFGGTAGSLHHHGNGTLLPIITCHGYRNTLTLFIQPENDKLAGHGMPCNQRCLDFKQAYAFCLVEESLCYYPITHSSTSPSLYFPIMQGTQHFYCNIVSVKVNGHFPTDCADRAP